MQNSEVVKSWVSLADADLKSARILAERHPPLNENACFHAQQAVEKALKSILVANGEFPTKTHALDDVLKEVAKYTGELEAYSQKALFLNPFAVISRYPNQLEIDDAITKKALAYAEEISRAAKSVALRASTQ
ncbi:MAG: HEPN domain-containing protein [Coriobacteriales bacterium]|jgi:HEPN domain-containing protein|nr:HEPN domain-containing protein [Coriobacteriales bacterium]